MENICLYYSKIFYGIIRYILTAQVKVKEEYEQITQKRMVLIH